MVVSPHDPNKMAFGVSDGVIRMWNFSKPCGEIQTFWRKVKGKYQLNFNFIAVIFFF